MKRKTEDLPLIMTAGEVREHLNLSVRKLNLLIDAEQLPVLKFKGRKWRQFAKADVIRLDQKLGGDE